MLSLWSLNNKGLTTKKTQKNVRLEFSLIHQIISNLAETELL